MTGYLYLLMVVGFVGCMACAYLLGRLDGIAHEKRRAAHVRRMASSERR